MIGFSGSGAGGAADFLLKLLSVLADPKVTAQTINELRSAEAAAEDRIAAANKRDQDSLATKREREADADAIMRAAVDKDRAVEEASAGNMVRTRGLDLTERNLAGRESRLNARDEEIETKASKVATREGAVFDRETNVKNRSIRLTAAEREAEAKKVKYDNLIAAIEAVRSGA